MQAFRPYSLSVLFLALGFGLVNAAAAADLPKRKSGLWEMKTQMEGMPSHGPMQMCVDQTSDNLMQQRGPGKSPTVASWT